MLTPVLKAGSKAKAVATLAPLLASTSLTSDVLVGPMSFDTATDLGTKRMVFAPVLLPGFESPATVAEAEVRMSPLAVDPVRPMTVKVALPPAGRVSVPPGPPAPERGPTAPPW